MIDSVQYVLNKRGVIKAAGIALGLFCIASLCANLTGDGASCFDQAGGPLRTVSRINAGVCVGFLSLSNIITFCAILICDSLPNPCDCSWLLFRDRRAAWKLELFFSVACAIALWVAHIIALCAFLKANILLDFTLICKLIFAHAIFAQYVLHAWTSLILARYLLHGGPDYYYE